MHYCDATSTRILPVKLPDPRYAAWGIGLALTAALPMIAGFTTLAWEFSEVCGLAGAIACLALCGCPVRPRESDPSVLLSLGRHEMLGWIALGAAVLHVLLAVASDQKVVEYLKLTAPLYQLMGIAALVVLLLLAVTSVAGVRRRAWHSHRNFQATHIIFACLLAVLLGAHVITTGRYTGGYGRRIVYVAAAAGGIAILLRRRRCTRKATHEPVVTRRLAFGRHSTLIVGVIAAAMLSLGSLIPGRALVALREPLLPRAQTLPLNFDHRKHTAINCLVCHHNYADGRGFDACIFCHRSARTDLKVGVEARFHDFCLNCHRHPGPTLPRHGPVSGCTICHQPPAT
jgi:DMSO/TMAO reductase YedYZ heme-binding membrane subunit